MVLAGDASPDITLPDATWLAKLPNHAIFSPPMPARQVGLPDPPTSAACMAVRNADVLVSYGMELRMASLLEAKHNGSEAARTGLAAHTGIGTSSTTYKRLTAPALDFDIERLIVNPTGKLVAAVGSRKIAIVVLPRPGSLASKGSTSKPAEVGVKAAVVGPYYHHDRIGGKARLADVKWHPWGELGSSLLVMTRDGILREYNVSLDVEEPVQTVSLLPGQTAAPESAFPIQSRYRSRGTRSRSRSRTPTAAAGRTRSRRSTSRLAFEDDSASDDGYDDEADESFYTAAGSIRSSGAHGRTAVAFTLGIDPRVTQEGEEEPSIASDWTPLTVYTLCTNGDLYALCPFMPTSASLPSAYLHSLASYIGLARPQTSSGSGDEGDLQVRFISSLLKQASLQKESSRVEASPTPRRALSATPMSIDDARGGSVEPDETVLNEELAAVSSPNSTIVPRQPQPQGPFLLAPAPHELSEDREARGADVFFASVSNQGNSLNVIGIASDDGRVDICVALESLAPNWSVQMNNKRAPTSAKPGRYALSDSDDDDDNLQLHADAPINTLPTLFVYESIDLGILSQVSDIDSMEPALRSTSLRFVADPLYADLIYVHHLAGAHAIGFGSWARNLLDVMNADVEQNTTTASTIQRFLHQGTPSDVVCIVNTVPQEGLSSVERINPMRDLCIVSDIYLCYSFLALAQSGTLVALELSLRIDDPLEEAIAASQANRSDLHPLQADNKAPPAYASLLGDGPPFTSPAPFKSLRGLPAQPRSATSGISSSSELRVTPETLRTLATTVQNLRGQMREVVQGGNTVQARLELQLEELKRQLGKLDQVAKRIDARQQNGSTGVKGDGQSALDARLTGVLQRQESIVRRSDRLLQRLIESHSPELSIYERRWLDELTRLQTELGKAGRDAEETNGLAARVEALRYRLELLKPDLEEAAAKHAGSGGPANAGPSKSLLGSKQMRQIESMLESERKLLTLDQQKIQQLNALVQRQLRAASRPAAMDM